MYNFAKKRSRSKRKVCLYSYLGLSGSHIATPTIGTPSAAESDVSDRQCRTSEAEAAYRMIPQAKLPWIRLPIRARRDAPTSSFTRTKVAWK